MMREEGSSPFRDLTESKLDKDSHFLHLGQSDIKIKNVGLEVQVSDGALTGTYKALCLIPSTAHAHTCTQ